MTWTRPSALLDAMRTGPVALDGGLGTHLEQRGNSVASALWSAEILRDRPDEVRAAHLDFFAAGARVATTASYQVTYEGLASIGLSDDDTDELLLRSVRLAREARKLAGLSPDEAWVLASVGPYGASPGPGTEYDGAYGLSSEELRAWHRPRLRVLDASGADAILAETVPSLPEVDALCAEFSALRTPAMLSVTVADGRLRDGSPLSEVARIVEAAGSVSALGVNCSAIPDAGEALEILAETYRGPLLVYPNSGEAWDAEARVWRGTGRTVDGAVDRWIDAGAALIGGCCRVGTAEISRIAERLRT